MKTYHKIQTVWKRDPANKNRTLLDGEWALPEFEYLASLNWEFTEKVDGTNVRVLWDGERTSFAGKTDNAQMPPRLLAALMLCDFGADAMSAQFGKEGGVCLYGEGYGAKIQKGGGNYRQDNGFVLFDVRVGDWWLMRKDIEEIGKSLGLDVVPVIGVGDLHSMVARCMLGFKSTWGDFQAEGIVARPMVPLQTRNGHRVIAKLKCKDFRRINQ